MQPSTSKQPSKQGNGNLELSSVVMINNFIIDGKTQQGNNTNMQANLHQQLKNERKQPQMNKVNSENQFIKQKNPMFEDDQMFPQATTASMMGKNFMAQLIDKFKANNYKQSSQPINQAITNLKNFIQSRYPTSTSLKMNKQQTNSKSYGHLGVEKPAKKREMSVKLQPPSIPQMNFLPQKELHEDQLKSQQNISDLEESDNLSEDSSQIENDKPIPAFTSTDVALKHNRTKSADRYINEQMECELDSYKEEIERKFKKSEMKQYVFPRQPLIQQKQIPPIVEYYDHKEEMTLPKEIAQRPLSQFKELHKRVKSNMTAVHSDRVHSSHSHQRSYSSYSNKTPTVNNKITNIKALYDRLVQQNKLHKQMSSKSLKENKCSPKPFPPKIQSQYESRNIGIKQPFQYQSQLMNDYNVIGGGLSSEYYQTFMHQEAIPTISKNLHQRPQSSKGFQSEKISQKNKTIFPESNSSHYQDQSLKKKKQTATLISNDKVKSVQEVLQSLKQKKLGEAAQSGRHSRVSTIMNQPSQKINQINLKQVKKQIAPELAAYMTRNQPLNHQRAKTSIFDEYKSGKVMKKKAPIISSQSSYQDFENDFRNHSQEELQKIVEAQQNILQLRLFNNSLIVEARPYQIPSTIKQQSCKIANLNPYRSNDSLSARKTSNNRNSIQGSSPYNDNAGLTKSQSRKKIIMSQVSMKKPQYSQRETKILKKKKKSTNEEAEDSKRNHKIKYLKIDLSKQIGCAAGSLIYN